MEFMLSAGTRQQLIAKMVDSGIVNLVEGGIETPEGIFFSYAGASNDEYHAFVKIDETIVKNAADILTRIQADVNKPGAPLRAKVGDMPPQVIDAIPDYAVRKALASLSLETAWNNAVTATNSKPVVIWWERAKQITTLEPEWRLICDRMAWGKESESALISTAKSLI
jgi:hypothetical protein